MDDESIEKRAKLRVPVALAVVVLASAVAAAASCGDDTDGSGGSGGEIAEGGNAEDGEAGAVA